MAEAWNPDWTLAPAATLADWLEENGLTVRAAGMSVQRSRRQAAEIAMLEVLDRWPLTADHAGLLHLVTGIKARFWARYEENYRAGLAAGKTDVTPDDDALLRKNGGRK